MSDIEFVEGIVFKAPREGAPEYVKGKLSIKREELIAWLSKREGEWINADVKVSQGGKWYCAVDNWKPDSKRQDSPKRQTATTADDDGPPF